MSFKLHNTNISPPSFQGSSSMDLDFPIASADSSVPSVVRVSRLSLSITPPSDTPDTPDTPPPSRIPLRGDNVTPPSITIMRSNTETPGFSNSMSRLTMTPSSENNSPTVVLSPRSKAFSTSVSQAVHEFQNLNTPQEIRDQLFHHLERGTYVIGSIAPINRKVLNESIGKEFFFTHAMNIGLPIGKYLGFDVTNSKHIAQGLLPFCAREAVTPFAVFKPKDEVRGGINALRGSATEPNHVAKHGILPEFEIANERVAATLFPLAHPVVQMTLDGPFNYNTNSNVAPKVGAAIGYLPSMAGFKQVSEIITALEKVSNRDVQKMAIMDLALCNTDRNPGNMLFNFETGELGLIDHALILPDEFRSPGVFAWMFSAKAHIPFTADALKQIDDLNYEEDRAKILAQYPNYPKGSLETMRITYHLLKVGARKGLTPFQIGCFLTENMYQYSQQPMRFMYDQATKAVEGTGENPYASMIKCIDVVISNLSATDITTLSSNEGALRKVWRERIESFFGNTFDSKEILDADS